MRRVLVTGMSGTGKSSALEELGRRGFRVVDTDAPGWKEWRADADGGAGDWVWREDRMAELLADEGERTLYVSGCVPNQGVFYDRFDAVVLLSAPADVLLERIETRTTNDYGKSPDERELVLADLASVEPRLRAICTQEIDTTAPIARVVETLIAISGEGA